MDSKEAIKTIIKQLHQGKDPSQLKQQFQDLLRSVSPDQLARIEQELIVEGMPREEVMRLCDVHLMVFKEALDQEKALAGPGHPIHILMAEHKALLGITQRLNDACTQGQARGIDGLIEDLKGSANHYLREENVLFAYLERHGVTQPPAIMWTEHDKIRAMEKELYRIYEQQVSGLQGPAGLSEATSSLYQMLSSHFYKENNVLFPTALKVIGEDQWPQIRAEFDQIGYCRFTPGQALVPFGQATAPVRPQYQTGKVAFETGDLSIEQLGAILDTLPVDITFVDKDDTVRYFNQSKDRIFLRTKAVIGRKVQQCHPQKSIHVVNQILDDFRAGKRDVADFWINLKGRLVYIRYLPVRDGSGQYLGCLEVTQDVTEIKGLQGEKRLL